VSGETVAIKLIKGAYANQYNFKLLLREITILKQLTDMRNNMFTAKLKDIIMEGNLVWLVMDYKSLDLKRLFNEPKPDNF
jgi:serine/threonine protein kinase